MKVRVRRGELQRRRAGAIALGVFEGARELSGAARAVDRASRGAITRLLERRDFRGRFLELAVLYPPGLGAPRVVLVGLGAAAEFSARRVRQAAAAAARRVRDLGAGTLATVAFGAGAGGLDPERAAQATAEGVVLGSYRYATYRRELGRGALRATEILEHDPARARAMAAAAERGARWAAAASLARDLANTPGDDMTPEHLADRAREIGRRVGARVEVLGVPRLRKLGMGALLAVGRGSAKPPRLVVMEWRPGGRGATGRGAVAVVGKGITFDTGGISLKPRENMHQMKGDMAGAAAVLGMFSALPSLDLPFRVVGILACAENMPGGRALKPGDIVRAMDGTTIEVTNTDAEGRLVLADALAYARRFEPQAVVDLATLTGAVSIALGPHAAGLFTDDETLAVELASASEASGERLWRLPVWDDYAPQMRSDVADLVNSAGAREGGAILGAVFLKHFARGLPWAHLDIASTAWAAADAPHQPRGPTGFGVRLLLEWLSRRASSSLASSPGARRARPAVRSPRG